MIQQIYKSLHLQKFWTWSTQCYPHWRWHTEMNDVCTPCNFLVWGPLSWETSLWILSCWNSHVSKIMFIYIHANNKAFFFLNKCNSSSLLSIFIKTHTKIALKVSGKGGGGGNTSIKKWTGTDLSFFHHNLSQCHAITLCSNIEWWQV